MRASQEPPPPRLEPGTHVLGDYVVARQLELGPRWFVHEVRRPGGRSRDRMVLYTLRATGAGRREFVRELVRQLQLRAKMSHPSLAQVVAYGVEFDRPMLVVVDPGGTPLDERIRAAGGALEPREAVAIVRELAGALDYLHGREPPAVDDALVARDVLVTGTVVPHVVLRAAGLSHALRLAASAPDAPEFDEPLPQLRAAPEARWSVDPATDHARLAAIALECVAGRAPTFDPAGEVDPACIDVLPPPLAALFERAFAPDLAARFESAAAFARAYADALGVARRSDVPPAGGVASASWASAPTRSSPPSARRASDRPGAAGPAGAPPVVSRGAGRAKPEPLDARHDPHDIPIETDDPPQEVVVPPPARVPRVPARGHVTSLEPDPYHAVPFTPPPLGDPGGDAPEQSVHSAAALAAVAAKLAAASTVPAARTPAAGAEASASSLPTQPAPPTAPPARAAAPSPVAQRAAATTEKPAPATAATPTTPTKPASSVTPAPAAVPSVPRAPTASQRPPSRRRSALFWALAAVVALGAGVLFAWLELFGGRGALRADPRGSRPAARPVPAVAPRDAQAGAASDASATIGGGAQGAPSVDGGAAPDAGLRVSWFDAPRPEYPEREDRDHAQLQLELRARQCAARHGSAGARVRLLVRYEGATGRALRVWLPGYLAQHAAFRDCVERAVREVALPPFHAATWTTPFTLTLS